MGNPQTDTNTVMDQEQAATEDFAKKAEEKLLAMPGDKADGAQMAEPIIRHLIERVHESQSLAQDVCKEGRDWKGCYSYIYESAKTYLNSKSGAVPDNTVYEWAEDYFHASDKEVDEVIPKPRKTQLKKSTAKTEAEADEKKPQSTAPEKPAKPKKKGKEIEGQMDLFTMFGIEEG